jgi:hypothetical protein
MNEQLEFNKKVAEMLQDIVDILIKNGYVYTDALSDSENDNAKIAKKLASIKEGAVSVTETAQEAQSVALMQEEMEAPPPITA